MLKFLNRMKYVLTYPDSFFQFSFNESFLNQDEKVETSCKKLVKTKFLKKHSLINILF